MNTSAPLLKTLLGGTLAALLLAGCSAQQSQQGTASPAVPGSLQERAQSVMQLAHDKDYAGALAGIDSLTEDVRDAATTGELPRQQWLQAEAALAQLRTDLKTLTGGVSPASADTTTSAPAPSATPTPSTPPKDDCDDQTDRGSEDNAGTADDEEDWQDQHDDWNDQTSNDAADAAGNGAAGSDGTWLAEAEWRDD
jgi:hypothetical protein